jgi:hypothetical protein
MTRAKQPSLGRSDDQAAAALCALLYVPKRRMGFLELCCQEPLTFSSELLAAGKHVIIYGRIYGFRTGKVQFIFVSRLFESLIVRTGRRHADFAGTQAASAFVAD